MGLAAGLYPKVVAITGSIEHPSIGGRGVLQIIDNLIRVRPVRG